MPASEFFRLPSSVLIALNCGSLVLAAPPPLTVRSCSLLIGPPGLGHEMEQSLMPGAGVQRVDPSGHRLYALA